MALQVAAQKVRESSNARAVDGISATAKAIKRHAAAIKTFSLHAELLSDGQLQQCCTKFEELAIWCHTHTLHYETAAPQSQKGWNRQDADRVCKPLFNRKRRRSAQSAASDELLAASDEESGSQPTMHDPQPFLPNVDPPLPESSDAHSEEQPDTPGMRFAPVRSTRPILNERGLGNFVRPSQRAYARRPAR